MRKKLLIGYIIFVHLFLLLALVKSDFISRVGYMVGLIRPVVPEITEHFKEMIKYHKRMDPNVPDGAVIFIGDSITQGLYVSAVTTHSVNYGIGSDTTIGVLKRLPTYHSLERASVCVMAIGVNDLQRRENEEILKNYSLILQAVPPHLPLILNAVLPVDERVRDDLAGMNRRIRTLNRSLKALCKAESAKCTFVDPGRKLMDPSGNLKAKYQVGDGIHLNGFGNAIWIQELKGIIQKVQQVVEVGHQTTHDTSGGISGSSLAAFGAAHAVNQQGLACNHEI
jgi:lysophospholipase L1-like esterase